MPTTVGEIAVLTRFPVKSLAGEQLGSVRVERRGIVGDRAWAVYGPDGGIGSGKTTRRFRRMPGLLDLAARLDGIGPMRPDGAGAPGGLHGGEMGAGDLGGGTAVPLVVMPDGRAWPADAPQAAVDVSAHLGLEVRLARETTVDHFDDGPLHLLTTGSLAALSARVGAPVDPRRFRANLLVASDDPAGAVEDDWVGRHLAVGEVVLSVRAPMPRCVMVDMRHRGVSDAAPVLKALGEFNDTDLGVVLDVVRAGVIAVGDPVSLLD